MIVLVLSVGKKKARHPAGLYDFQA